MGKEKQKHPLLCSKVLVQTQGLDIQASTARQVLEQNKTKQKIVFVF